MDRNTVNYKALAFIADQTASTFHYEIKGVRALWDPSLSIPGTNRRGGWRCPLGTRFGGQITDRYGRSCGWGVARRLANGIADIGERLESIDDRKRNARVAKRNARVARQLVRDVKPGLLERGARGIADALDGGGGKPVRKPKFDRPRIGGIRRAEQQGATVERIAERVDRPPSRPRTPDALPADTTLTPKPDTTLIPKPARKPRKRGNLRDSEARRMERELVQPGAPRTGDAPAQPPQPPPLNRPRAPRARRRDVSNQGAARSVRRVPTENDIPEAPPARPIVPAQRSRPPQPPARPKPQAQIPAQPPQPPARPKPASKVPKEPSQPPALKPIDLVKEFAEGNNDERRIVNDVVNQIENYKFNAGNNMRMWGDQNKDELARNIEIARRDTLVDAERLAQAQKVWEEQKGDARLRKGAGDQLIRAYTNHEKNKNNLDAMENRLKDINEGKPWAPPAPARRIAPPQPPETSIQGVEEVVPDNQIVPLADAGKRSPRKIGREQKLNDAIKQLHEGQGNLADIQDGIVIDAVVDGEFKDGNLPNGKKYTDSEVEKFLKNGFKDFERGAKFENRRYKFELVKQSNGAADVWCVLKVVDKNNGEQWFMKSSTYGANDGMLENIGMRAAQALEFGNDENHLRLGDVIKNDPRNGGDVMPRRWVMMRDIHQWENGVQGEWKDAAKGLEAFADQINPRDVGRIAVLDMVLDNRDRHGGNFMWVKEGDRVRLGVIDHGLLGGGRRDGVSVDEVPDHLQRWADDIVANPGVRNYAGQFNNGISGLRHAGYRVRNDRDRRILKETMRRSVEKMKQDLDTILGVDRIERNGAKLSDIEKTHIDALKRVAKARIAWIETHLDDMVGQFS